MMHRTFKLVLVLNLLAKEQSLQNSTYFMHSNSNNVYAQGPVHLLLNDVFGSKFKLQFAFITCKSLQYGKLVTSMKKKMKKKHCYRSTFLHLDLKWLFLLR